MEESATAKAKHSMLPLLVVLFLVSYGIMTLLVVEQARTIDTQRNLINVLFDDSAQLSAMKGKAAQQQYATTHPQGKSQSQAPSPSSQAKEQNPDAQTPSSQAPPRSGANSAKTQGNASKARRQSPLRPPKDTSDEADERRALISI
jgi:hypothetical protein